MDLSGLNWIKRYGFAVLITVLMLGFALALNTVITVPAFTLFLGAVALSSWVGGLGPGILSALLGVFLLDFFFIAPLYVIHLSMQDTARLGLFTLVAFLISWMTESQRRLRISTMGERELLRTTLASIGDAVIATDTQGHVYFMNPVAERLTGWKQHDAMHRDIRDVFKIINEHSRLPVENPVERVIREGTIVELANHTILITRNGQEIAIDDSGSPIRDEHGAINGAVLVFRDVRDHRAAQDAQARLAAIISSSTDAIISEDLTGIITSWNQAAEQMYGYTAQEAIGKSIAMLIPTDHRDDLQHLIERTRQGERVEHFETQRQHKDGSVRDVSLTLSPVYDFYGKVIGISKIARDITERKRQTDAQRFLSESSTILASSLDYQTTLQSVARLAVPNIADWCTVNVVEADGTVQEVALAHVDPAKIQWVNEFRKRYPPDPNAATGVYNVIRTGQAEYFPEIPYDLLVKAAKDDAELLRIFEEIHFTSSMTVPMTARGRTLGALTFVSAEGGRHYTEADVELARQLAERAGIAVDNALLYRDAQLSRQAAERLADRKTRLQAITASLSNLLDPSVVANTVITQVLAALPEARGGLVALLEDNEWLHMVHWEGYPEGAIEKWQRLSINDDMPVSVAVRRAEPILLDSPETWKALFPDAPALMVSESLALLPLFEQGKAIGALVISFSTAQRFDEEDRAFLLSVAQQCSQALERSRLYAGEQAARAHAEANQQQLTFLAQASELLASSLEYQTTLTSVAKLAVPFMADWCSLHMVQKDGSVAQTVTHHRDPQKIALADEYRRRYPSDPNARTGAYNVLRTGKSEFNPEVPDELLARLVKDEEQLRMLRQFGFKSGMLVPITVRGKSVGVIQFIYAESGRQYNPHDLVLAEEVARRAGIAVENSLLYAEAQEQRESLKVTLSSIGDAVIATDAQGRITFMNPVSEELTRWTQADATGHDLHDVFRIVNESTRQTVESPVTKVMREGMIVGLANHTILIARDGSEVPIDDSGAPIRDAEGNIIGVILVFRDISERKRAEDKERLLAAASETFSSSLDYETILENIARMAVPAVADWCAIDVKEEDGSLRQVTIAHSDPAKEAIVKKIREDFLPVNERPNPVLGVLRTGKPYLMPEVTDAAIRASFPDDETFGLLRALNPVSMLYVPLISRGEAVGVLSFTSSESGRHFDADDIALAEELARRAAVAIENARLYRDSQQAIQMRDEFLSVAAHELKTPVTSLRGFAQTIIRQLDRDNTLDPMRVRRALEAIDQQSLKLASLISQLLDISRIEAGRLELDRRPTDVAALVADVVSRAQANTSRHEIKLDVPPTLKAEVDPLRFEQVLTNLVDNAVKYSPEGGPIEINVSALNSHGLSLAVTDRGLGIPPEHRPRIFERFYQVHRGSMQGMGLGLYISRQIVELHGGEIYAEFPDGGGTRFVVTLPAVASA